MTKQFFKLLTHDFKSPIQGGPDFASLNKWITHPSDLLTTGIRDAYLHGLEVALPVEKDTLGFSMGKADAQ